MAFGTECAGTAGAKPGDLGAPGGVPRPLPLLPHAGGDDAAFAGTFGLIEGAVGVRDDVVA